MRTLEFPVLKRRDMDGIVQEMRRELTAWLASPQCQSKGTKSYAVLKDAARTRTKQSLMGASMACEDLFYWFAAEGVACLLDGREAAGWASLRKAVYAEGAAADLAMALDRRNNIQYTSTLHGTVYWPLALFLADLLGDVRTANRLSTHLAGYFRSGAISEVIEDDDYRSYLAAVLAKHTSPGTAVDVGSLGVFAPLMSSDAIGPRELEELTLYHVMRVDHESAYCKRKGIQPVFAVTGFDLMPIEILAAIWKRANWEQIASTNSLLGQWQSLTVPSTDAVAQPVEPLVEACYEAFGIRHTD